MAKSETRDSVRISVVVPLFNEAENAASSLPSCSATQRVRKSAMPWTTGQMKRRRADSSRVKSHQSAKSFVVRPPVPGPEWPPQCATSTA